MTADQPDAPHSDPDSEPERWWTVPPEFVRDVRREAMAAAIVERLLGLGDLTPSVADAMDRLETAEVNGTVRLGDVPVEPGDLIVADENGVVAVPAALVATVLTLCEQEE